MGNAVSRKYLQYFFFCVFLRKSNAVVLTIRGTLSLSDAISDIVCDEEPFLDGFAHRGILSGAR
jgi:hypothetical protein